MEILAQSSADFALTYNFQGTHILGASRGHLSDSVIFLLLISACYPAVANFLYCRPICAKKIMTVDKVIAKISRLTFLAHL